MTVIQDPYTNKFRMSLVEDSFFQNAIESLQSFVLENDADLDMAYEWVCDVANIHSFVTDTPAWDLFFETFTEAVNDD